MARRAALILPLLEHHVLTLDGGFLDPAARFTCEPATAPLTLTDGASSANKVIAALAGKTCTWTKSGSTNIVCVSFGRGTATGSGTLAAALTGKTGEAVLLEKADGSVKGRCLRRPSRQALAALLGW